MIGYARVSTEEQDLTAQRDGLAALGVESGRIYVDHGRTGTNRDRPGLREALAACRAGVTLVRRSWTGWPSRCPTQATIEQPLVDIQQSGRCPPPAKVAEGSSCGTASSASVVHGFQVARRRGLCKLVIERGHAAADMLGRE